MIYELVRCLELFDSVLDDCCGAVRQASELGSVFTSQRLAGALGARRD